MYRLLGLSAILVATSLLHASLRQQSVSSFQLHPVKYYYVNRRNNSWKINTLQNYSNKQTWASDSSRNRFKSRRPSNLIHQSRYVLNSFGRITKQYRSAARQRELITNEIDYLLETQDLTTLLLPRDASSLIRLLGRKRLHDAMLKFCKRYCHDIIEAATNENSRFTKADSEESVLYCYTAAISACSKPSSNLSKVSHVDKYRNTTFLLSLLDEMERQYTKKGELIKPNSYTLSAILLGIDNGTEALEVLEKFEQKYCPDDSGSIVSVQVYNAAISACARSARGISKKQTNDIHDWQFGLSLYNRMKRHGPTPNERTHCSVLEALAEFGQLMVAKSLFDEIKQHSTSELKSKMYKPLLKACAIAEKAAEAEAFIQQMRDDCIVITIEHMNLYLLALSKSKYYKKALEVLQEMLDSQEMAPDIVTFNTVLAACANADQYEAARDLLDDMRAGTFYVSDDDNVQQTLKEVRPDTISYNTVISCADPYDALDLINEMRLTRRNRDGICLPNSISYTNAITRCRKASVSNDPEIRRYAYSAAFTLFELARESAKDESVPRVVLNEYVYSSLIWLSELVGDFRAAVQVLRSMECPPNAVCYDGVISALSKRGRHREALYFYYEMQKLGLQATRNIYLKLAFAINNSRDPEVFSSPRKKAALLEGVLSQMPARDKSVEVGGPLFELLIRCHGNKAEHGSSHAAARAIFDQIIGPVDNACLSVMVRVYSSFSMWEEAVMLLHCSDIVKGAAGPGRISTRALSYAVIACAKAHHFEEAFNLIDLYRDDSTQNTDKEVVSIAALNSLIASAGRTRPDIAVQTLNEMQTKYRTTPDVKSYRLAIIACNQAEHREAKNKTQFEASIDFTWWECALSLLRRMLEDGLTPDAQTYSSVVSALESAGQWQRALAVLQSIPSMSPLFGTGLRLKVTSSAADELVHHEPPNLHIINAALSVCEKGGAWVEALSLYENIRAMENHENSTKPNFITVNILLQALEKAGQIELGQDIYEEALRDRIVKPTKRRVDNDGTIQRMLDLHQFSAPMAKIATRSFLNSLIRSSKEPTLINDAVFIVGKGKGSEGEPVLLPTVTKLLTDEYGLNASIDPNNSGRIRVTKQDIEAFVKARE